MYRCESWTIKKAEHQRINAFELWCWRRLLRFPWKARSNQSILKKINPDCSLEGLMLKLKVQSFGHLMGRTDSLKNTLMLAKIEGRGEGDDRGWDGWMASPIQWIWTRANSGRWWGTRRPGVLQTMGSQRVGHSHATELNWNPNPKWCSFKWDESKWKNHSFHYMDLLGSYLNFHIRTCVFSSLLLC